MSNNIQEGEFYINQRKNQEKCLSKDLDIIEGFTVVSRQDQKKNPSKFYIPDGSDPGQTVMCEPDKIRYVRLSQTNNYLTIQEVQVFDQTGRNVAIQGGYSNEFELTQGFCRKTTNEGVGVGTPGSIYKGQLTTGECEQSCSTGCTAYEIQTEGSTEGLNPGCWTYQDPTVKGDGNKAAMCRVKQREPGTPIATMSSYYTGTNPYIAINGNTSDNQAWPNSACTQSATGGWWEVDLGKSVNVKKVVVFNRPDCCQDRLSGAQLTLIDNQHRTVLTKTLTSKRRQVFNIENEKKICGGPVLQKNMDDFEALTQLRNTYNKQLQEYNQSMKAFLEDSQQFVNASNKNNNKFANSYVRDEANGAVGYVSSTGVWKWITSPSQGKSIQGKSGCPPNSSNYTNTKADSGQLYTIGNAPQGEIVKMNGQELIKGSNMIYNQTCNNAGQNIYVTKPSVTTNRTFASCSKYAGEYQSDLGHTTMDACSRRAADLGSNVFQLGPDEGNGRGSCYIGGGGNTVRDSICSVAPGVGRMGRNMPGEFKNVGGDSFWDWDFEWVSGYTAYATYQTNNANNSNLGQTFHITDNLTKKQYPNNMISGYGDEFELQRGYNSYGNDIVSGSGLSIEQIKQKCRETPGAAGFYVNGNNYWIKNANMWPNGERQYTGGDLYVRVTAVNNSNSCSNKVNFSKQEYVNGYVNDGMMNLSSTCALGTINQRDREAINMQYTKLQGILNQIKEKIRELAGEDIRLNKRLMDEQKIMEKRLKTYEQVYSQIGIENTLIGKDSAFGEDANLNMLSNNKRFIIWSILALGLTFGAMKFTK
jgi:hypothetical protein